MTDPRGDFFASGSQDSGSGDPRADFFASGGEIPDEPEKPAPVYGKTLKEAGGDLALRAVSSIGANIMAGGRAMWDMTVGGKTLSQADDRAQQYIREHTYQPKDALSQGLAKAWEGSSKAPGVQGFIERNANPLNLPGTLIGKASDVMGEQVSPEAAGVTSGVLQAALALATLKGGMQPLAGTPTKGFRGAPAVGAPAAEAAAAAPELTTSSTSRAPAFEPQDVPGSPGVKVDTEPVEGGLPKMAQGDRAQILQRVGLENARDSALEGNAKNAATDYQLSKFDEPAGVQAKAQFDAERAALEKHSEAIVQKTSGTLGTDEDTVNTRGQTIARPFDALSEWFDAQRKALYGAADQRAGGAPVTKLESVDALLQDPKFRNTLLAKDQGNLLNSIENQLAEFRKQSPEGFNVQGAENVRKWLNEIWTNDNKHAIGQVKDALDNDVLKGAGEDIYGPARALVQMKKQTLDNPSGINKLMEHDPQTPINRTTSFDKIPDTLTRLPPAQFDQVIKTLDAMPEEIQPLAQAAKSEIKAHLANKIHDAGKSTQGQWNAPGVEKVVKANSAKLQSAFADQPQLLNDIQDLRSAGKILRVDQSYPGAAAQAANTLKRGLMSRAMTRVGATAGAGAGSILGPLGAAGGAALGEAAGSSVGGAMSERAAVKQWQKGISRLSELPK